MPPPKSKIASRRDVPMGTSIRPLLTTFPERDRITVPLLFLVPICEYQSAPREIITGTLARVFTLLITVGFPQRPDCAGYGGRERGTPLFPSMVDISAVSSPQINAPIPSLIRILKSKSDSNICFPRYPFSSAILMAS